ncbi:MAG: DUF2252 domain-containing protein [Mucilaginibacter sp.]
MSDIYKRIINFNKGLLPDIVKLKYAAMAENIYRFYRGTCHLFYEDICKIRDLPPSPAAWICGDLHLENYGSYKGNNHLVYFDLNDFDEAILAPCTWEVSRMATSIFIAFENLEIEEEKAVKMVRLFLKCYGATLARGKAISIDPRTAQGIVCTFLNNSEKRKTKELLKKRTTDKRHKLFLSIDGEKHFELEKSLKKDLTHFINDWIKTSTHGVYDYKVIDSVFRVAGTGSVGVKRYLILLKSVNTKNRYLLIDMKQAKRSSLAPYVAEKQPQWETEGERVMQIQQRMQNICPALLSAVLFKDESFVLQEMQPAEDTISFELIKDRYRDIYQVINDMAVLSASSQVRSSGRQRSAIADKLIAFGENTEWQYVILNYSQQYAKQVKKDYRQYITAYSAKMQG